MNKIDYNPDILTCLASLSNDAVFKFKRYEESSLSYTGICKHKVEQIEGYDIIITAEKFNRSKANL